MSKPPAQPVPSWLARSPRQRSRADEEKPSYWRALRAAVAFLFSWHEAGVFIALFFYLVALAVVGAARALAGEEVRPDDPVLLVVAASLAAATVVVVATGLWWHRRRAARHRARVKRWAQTRGWAYAPRSSMLSSRWNAPGIPRIAQVTDVLTRAAPG